METEAQESEQSAGQVHNQGEQTSPGRDREEEKFQARIESKGEQDQSTQVQKQFK